MDYTLQELRSKIYCDRTDIDCFDVDNPNSLDALMLERIEHSKIIDFDGAAGYILDIFNNAYYITTLILMEKHPVHYLSKYFIIAEHTASAYKDIYHHNTNYRYFEAIIMAMVSNYLCACRPDLYSPLDNTNRLLSGIWDYHNKTFYATEWDSDARFLFFNNVLNDVSLKEFSVKKDWFKPLTSPEQLLNANSSEYEEPASDINTPADVSSEELARQLREAEEAVVNYKERIGLLEDDLRAFQDQNPKAALTSSEAMMLMLTICDHIGGLPTYRKNISPLLERCWGFTAETAERAFGHKPTKDLAERVANKFEDISPKLAKLIKAFPDKSEKMRIEKLQANNDKKANF